MNHDVIIIGGGLVGTSLAIALDAHGVTSAIVDAADLDATLTTAFDGRASAIASASARMLRAIGLGTLLEAQGCPIRQIRVTDALSPQYLHFDARSADDPGDNALGYMIENRHLRAGLLTAARAAAGITLHTPAVATSIVRDGSGVTVTLADGQELRAPLLVAADGRKSPIRERAGIAVARWSYAQTAIVTMIGHQRPHDNVALELFYPTGPFAVLPMLDAPERPGNRSAIVWTVDNKAAAGTMKLGPRALGAEIDRRVGGLLGRIEMLAPAASHPLGYHHAAAYTAERLILVGDAAHGIHPIAGQGLNMGLRDVAALAEVLVDSARLGLDLGAPAVAARYSAWRRLDNSMVGAVTDGLNRLFALKGTAPAAVRRVGLAAVQRLPSLKRRFMAEARGETGDRPRLLLGERL